jgi:hypothetical protein
MASLLAEKAALRRSVLVLLRKLTADSRGIDGAVLWCATVIVATFVTLQTIQEHL